MTRHGLSHAAAAVAAPVASALLLEYLRAEMPVVTRAADRASALLVAALDLPWQAETVSFFLVAGALAGVWGAAFGLANR